MFLISEINLIWKCFHFFIYLLFNCPETEVLQIYMQNIIYCKNKTKVNFYIN